MCLLAKRNGQVELWGSTWPCCGVASRRLVCFNELPQLGAKRAYVVNLRLFEFIRLELFKLLGELAQPVCSEFLEAFLVVVIQPSNDVSEVDCDVELAVLAEVCDEPSLVYWWISSHDSPLL